MVSSSRRARRAFLLSLAVLVVPTAAVGQETLDTLVAQRADSVDLVVTPTVSAAGSTVTFSYELTSLPTSTQTLFNFQVEVPGEGVLAPERPPGWDPAFPVRLGTELQGDRKVFGWWDISEAESVTPGATVEGFSFESDHLPGPTSYWAQGFISIPTFPSEADFPDVVVGSRLFENSVTGQTLGPVVPPGEVSTPAPTAAALGDVLALSCAEGWISGPAVCTQLEQALEDVEAALAAGEPGAAGAALDAFEQLVEAEADVTIDRSASSALDLYIDRLRGQGLVPDSGGEGGGALEEQKDRFETFNEETCPLD